MTSKTIPKFLDPNSIISISQPEKALLKMRDSYINFVVSNILSEDINLRRCAALAMYNTCWSQCTFRTATHHSKESDEFNSEIVAAICEGIRLESLGPEYNSENALRLVSSLGFMLVDGSDEVVELANMVDVSDSIRKIITCVECDTQKKDLISKVGREVIDILASQ